MKRYLSFSGGGFNSHSFLAGMLSGALDSLEDAGRIRDVGLLTQSVGGFSANSGGSWFLSQLSYSKPFLDQFESVQSADSYNSKGYNGRITDIFRAFLLAVIVNPVLILLAALCRILNPRVRLN